MTKETLRKGILYSLMWSLAYQLNNQYSNEPARKIKGIIFQYYQSYSEHQKQIFHNLRTEVWKHLEKRYFGDVNIPIMMTGLFWAFPELFGKRIQQWIDAMDDIMITHIPNDDTVKTSKDIAEWYIELIDKAIFDYMKNEKRNT